MITYMFWVTGLLYTLYLFKMISKELTQITFLFFISLWLLKIMELKMGGK